MTSIDAPAKVLPGSPRPLGATCDGRGTNFAIFASGAESVDICLFDMDDATPAKVISLPERTYGTFHGYVPHVGHGQRYGVRVRGPYAPSEGKRFNEQKLLIDPYTRALDGAVTWGPELFGYDVSTGDDTSVSRSTDDALVPKSLVINDAFDWGDDRPPGTSWMDTIIYEVHVKGFTEQHPDIPKDLRGTYLGMAHPAAIRHLTDLGVTAVELLPIHEFIDDDFLLKQGKRNYWGYNTLGFFAPAARYAKDPANGNQVAEFKTMVKALHAAGIEVLLDVVYNHTCEGNELGPTLAYRGLDNQAYYRQPAGDERHYTNYAGTGNTLDAHQPQVLTMITDSLRYWVSDMHVDGFRFDLAAVLGRETEAFDTRCGLFDAIHQDPVLSSAKLIAEPWDLGPEGYQVGNFPIRWSEWNDRFRDDVRTFWQTTQPTLPAMGYRLTGSADIYQPSGRLPRASVNLVTSHDGFTLHDLVTYARKHNDANGENNVDGHNHNISANYGIEGPTDDATILALRDRQQRNMLATLLFSQGTPMLLGGDEMGRTQQGNNNAYAQDNDISWFNWDVGERGKDLLQFTRRAISIRACHAALRRRLYFRGLPRIQGGWKDVMWFHPDGHELSANDWTNPSLQTICMRLAGDAIQEIDEHGDPIEPSSILLIFHAGEQEVAVTIPPVERGGAQNRWAALLSTDTPDGSTCCVADSGESLTVPGRTVMLFIPEHDVSVPEEAGAD